MPAAFFPFNFLGIQNGTQLHAPCKPTFAPALSHGEGGRIGGRNEQYQRLLTEPLPPRRLSPERRDRGVTEAKNSHLHLI